MQANAPDAAARTFERVTTVRELSGRKIPLSIAHAFAPSGAELVVIERYAPSATLDSAGLDLLEKDAHTAMTLRHPNINPVRDVWREAGEVRIACEFVEGETLEELRRLALGNKELTLEVGVRVVVDVLAALSALHALGLGGLPHGEVTATNVIIGFDGTTRLVRPFRGHIAGKVAEPDWFSYAAPEVVRGGAADVHADLFAVGVLLWETLSRRKLFPKATREGRAARSMPIGKPAAPTDATWAAPLGAVAERALANEPGARYTTAAEMAAAVRLSVRSKLAMPPRVASAVDNLANARILERRRQNAFPENAPVSKRPSLRPFVPDQAMRALTKMRPSSKPPTPTPGLVAMPVVPKAPPLPFLDEPPTVPKGPRPLAPPLKLAEPPPSAPSVVEETPISLDDAFVEPEPLVALPLPILALPPTNADIMEAGIPARNSRVIAIGAVALLLVFIAAAAIVALRSSSSTAKATKPTPTETVRPSPTNQATATVSMTVPTPTTTPTMTAIQPTPSATAEPEPSTSATPTAEPSHRPHTRPRPTYDPMGI